ncbi:hypothetical protein N5D77_06035 [Comamonas thiooxydans]|uniref:Uncharacterized protein n=1 Tax=Comamonas thiooxydans TaxID=363952 RepID=A0AA42TT04_9BURK|nr:MULTISPECIES: hypothetical protein [Comamonas]MDH1333259.1 hypothetical protein [Comamonas thiooxydans]MDH1738968.1 hypothetical protein [Comamonas thiooxydans]MDH1786129.1 hypothetical protein [Comamonas thiooxydans]
MPESETKETQLTAADAAKLVQRTVLEPVDGKGKFREKRVPVSAEEVLSCKDYGTHVVVVTRDGQKFTGQAK